MVENASADPEPSHGVDTLVSFMSVSQMWHLLSPSCPSPPTETSDKVWTLAQANWPIAVYKEHCSSSESLVKQSLFVLASQYGNLQGGRIRYILAKAVKRHVDLKTEKAVDFAHDV